jgi:hypothetical protein
MLDRPGEKNSNTIAPATMSLDMMLRFSSADMHFSLWIIGKSILESAGFI